MAEGTGKSTDSSDICEKSSSQKCNILTPKRIPKEAKLHRCVSCERQMTLTERIFHFGILEDSIQNRQNGCMDLHKSLRNSIEISFVKKIFQTSLFGMCARFLDSY
ncbi:Hypothetical predicted protein [Octopus vulgaris]|uniref:Uncharacterized protein n=1 Tax=Octopus vulgaris TaxID=6645 RepID=A0AA36FJX7_OCTVU|nr:Hypothetical predicted protein [Octopus vulgaris]